MNENVWKYQQHMCIYLKNDVSCEEMYLSQWEIIDQIVRRTAF